MSDYAKAELDWSYMTAWDYRTLYLGDGTKYENFYCPFCDIRLCANLIYKDGEISKSPYFSAKWENHRGNCDGEPIYVDKVDTKEPKSHYGSSEMRFPEALITRPVKRAPMRLENPPASSVLTDLEIDMRRRSAGKLGKPTPKTYILQPIVEVYNSKWKEGFEMVNAKIWSVEERVRLTKEILSTMTLQLEDKTNYYDAFKKSVTPNVQVPRIYFGDSTVNIVQSGFKIISDENKFHIEINETLVNKDSPKSHAKSFELLNNFAQSKTKLRWYAYAIANKVGDIHQLEVATLDFFYFKKSFQKRS